MPHGPGCPSDRALHAFKHGRVTVGVKDDGSPDRRHVERKSEAEVIDAVRKLERDRDNGTVRKAGRAMLVEAWLRHWLGNISRPSVKYKSYRAYRTAVEQHLVPGVGRHRIDKLAPEHLESCTPGSSPPAPSRPPLISTQDGPHRIRRGAPPGASRPESGSDREGASRRGRRDRAVRDRRHTTIDQGCACAPQRSPIRPGPRDRHAAGRDDRAEVEQVQPRHQDAADHAPVAAADLGARVQRPACVRSEVPQDEAVPRGLQAAHPGLPAAVPAELREPRSLVPATTRRRTRRDGGEVPRWPARDRSAQPACDTHRTAPAPAGAGARARRHGVEDGGWMFVQENGRPIDPTMDRNEWKRLLADAGVRSARLHDARHTAVTVLLLLGVPERRDGGGWGGRTGRWRSATST
jgi:hypothetical protein